MRSLSVLVLLLVACTGDSGLLGSSDTRIDGATAENDPESEGSRLCLDEAGAVHVVWSDAREGARGIWLNSSSDGGTTWRPSPVRIDQGTVGAFAPRIACAGGVIHVAWEDARDGELENSNVYYNRSTDGGATWLVEDQRLNLDEEGLSMSQGIDLVAVGTEVYVAWFDDAQGAPDIYTVASPDGGVTWGEPIRLDGDDPGAAWSAWPVLEADGEGHVYAVWQDARDGGVDIYATASDDGGATFFEERRIDGGDAPGAADSFAPRMAADDGRVYVVWHDQRNGAYRDVFMNWSINHGDNWAAEAVRVDSDSAGFYDSVRPDVVLQADEAHVAWQDARDGGYDVYLRDARQGFFHDAEYRVDGDAPGNGNSLDIHLLREGATLIAVWQDQRADDGSGYNDLYYNYSLDGGATWGEGDLRIDSNEPGTSWSVDLDVALRDGVIHATWTDGRRGNADIFYQSLEVGQEASYTVQ